jgi:hypothetical protein
LPLGRIQLEVRFAPERGVFLEEQIIRSLNECEPSFRRDPCCGHSVGGRENWHVESHVRRRECFGGRQLRTLDRPIEAPPDVMFGNDVLNDLWKRSRGARRGRQPYLARERVMNGRKSAEPLPIVA